MALNKNIGSKRLVVGGIGDELPAAVDTAEDGDGPVRRRLDGARQLVGSGRRDGESGGGELGFDVGAGLLDRRRSRRPRADRHQPSEMLPGAARVEFGRRRHRLDGQRRDEKRSHHWRLSLGM